MLKNISTFNGQRVVRFALVLVAILGLLAYAFVQVRAFVAGPQLTLLSPTHGATVTEPLIEIAGTATHISRITLNDRSIAIDEAGRFSEPHLLAPGYAILKIAVEDRFGRTQEELLALVYNPS